MLKYETLKTNKPKEATNLNTSIDIYDIVEIDENNFKITFKFAVTIKWFEARVSYNFLKNDATKNVIDGELWIPKIKFTNSKQGKIDSTEEVFIKRQGNLTHNTRFELLMNENYKGDKNSVIKINTYIADFICPFDTMTLYPFDTEVCTIDFIVEGTNYYFTKIVPSQISYHGHKQISEYTITKWQLSNKIFEDGKSGIQVEMRLGRNVVSIFLTTYLPTILMNIINQATNFLDGTPFSGDIIKVNMTCMMVLSAMYISVSKSLPTTVSIKYVEIWLLFSLIYHFIIILTQVFIKISMEIEKNITKVGSLNVEKKTHHFKFHLQKVNFGKFFGKKIMPIFGILFIIVYFLIGLIYF